MLIIGVATAGALVWIKLASVLSLPASDAGSVPAPVYPFTGASPLAGFSMMIAQTIPQLNGMIGNFSWLGTPAPEGIYALWLVLIGSLVLAGLVVLRGKAAILALVLGAAFVLLPALAQASYITSGGFIWQGRYTLPLLVMFIVGIGATLSSRLPNRTAFSPHRLALVILIAWGIGEIVCFAIVLRRYAVGLNRSLLSFLTDPKWQPPGGVITLLVLFVIATTAAIAAGVLWVAPLSSDRPARGLESQDPAAQQHV